MKHGKSLSELATELERQAESRADFVAPTEKLAMIVESRNLVDGSETPISVPLLEIEGEGEFLIGNTAHSQIAQRLGVPAKYYKRMRDEAPHLLADNVNHWFGTKTERRMIRTLDGSARAFLSDRYRTIDNYEIAAVALDSLAEHGADFSAVSCEITERRMYIQAVFPKLEREVKVGDVVQAGLVISNSEIGLGSVSIEPMLHRLVCLNGMVLPSAMKKYHVGKQVGDVDAAMAEQIFRDETREADDKAFMMKIADVISSSVREDVFATYVERMTESTTEMIEGKIDESVTVLANKVGLNETEGASVLRNLINGGDLSRWGMANAVTAIANDVDDYDRAIELERIGGNVIQLDKKDWTEIAVAA